MALVGYSDSEGSDVEETVVAPKPAIKAPAKGSAPRLIDPSAPRKIKVDLPTFIPEEKKEDERPAKRARTGGGFGGFNALLPAPKRTAETKKPGAESRVNLKTSASAAFSREPVEQQESHEDRVTEGNEDSNRGTNGDNHQALELDPQQKPAAEVKTVGNAMRFKPLSVASKKKPKKPIILHARQNDDQRPVQPSVKATAPPDPKPKVSLFSVTQEELEQTTEVPTTTTYEPLMTDHPPDPAKTTQATQPSTSFEAEAAAAAAAAPNTLDGLATSLNLSAADRRALFGRNSKPSSNPSGPNINIAHFNMESEYASNEALRAAGETVEHRAVKSVAPGKHSLQQLVNAASTQKEALADKWAEGKRNRGEAGNKYGW